MANLGEYVIIFFRLDRRTGCPIHSWSDVVTRQQLKELNHWAHAATPQVGPDLGSDKDYITVVHTICKL